MLLPLLLGASMAGLDETPLVPLSTGYYMVIMKGVKESEFGLVGNNGMTGMDIHNGGKVYVNCDSNCRVEVQVKGKEQEVFIYLRRVE